MSTAARRARRVLTVSEASKQDILHYLRVPADKIEVIYNALDDRLAEAPTPDEVARVRERFQLTAPFVLYAGNIKPHKNLERLIEAFALLRAAASISTSSCSSSATRSRSTRTCAALVHRYQLHQHVRFLGFVPDATLAVALSARVGLRLPVALRGLRTAAARGHGRAARRSITSNVSSLPEVVGDAALLIDPLDAGADRGRHGPGAHRRRAARGLDSARASSACRPSRGTTPPPGRTRCTRRSRARPLMASPRDPGGALEGRRARARPRLAHRHARRREGARGASAGSFRGADLITLVHVPGSVSPAIERRRIRTSFVQRLPGARRRVPPLPAALSGRDRAVRPRRLRSGDLDEPLRRQGRGADRPRACTSATATRPCGTPGTSSTPTSGPARVGPAAQRALPAASWPGWPAGTRDTARRVRPLSSRTLSTLRAGSRRYYNRDASVLYPPVDYGLLHARPARRPAPYFLVVSALVPYKRLDLAIDAGRPAGRPLKIVGSGPDEARLRAHGRTDGRVPRHARRAGASRRCTAAARRVLLPGEEDFGIVPVEALACGRPVVALGRGGAARRSRMA